ncbi:ATP synthase membrane subunit DAPIT, mitochondrial [Manis javanica]|nr:ATP synthase membrane subunit DAPIT, mitochondrial [Manis javanica]
MFIVDTICRIRAFLKIEIMAGPEADAQFQFTGIKKYFNSYTLTGRMNCVLATYGGIAFNINGFRTIPPLLKFPGLEKLMSTHKM